MESEDLSKLALAPVEYDDDWRKRIERTLENLEKKIVVLAKLDSVTDRIAQYAASQPSKEPQGANTSEAPLDLVEVVSKNMHEQAKREQVEATEYEATRKAWESKEDTSDPIIRQMSEQTKKMNLKQEYYAFLGQVGSYQMIDHPVTDRLMQESWMKAAGKLADLYFEFKRKGF